MDTDEKKSYELSFLIRDESAAPELVTLLKTHGADIGFEGPLKKISLMYQIKKESHAHFGYFHFQLAPEKLVNLEHELQSNQKILRFLIVTPPFVKSVKIPMAPSLRTKPEEGEKKVSSVKSFLSLSNEDLEKKIDEILQ